MKRIRISTALALTIVVLCILMGSIIDQASPTQIWVIALITVVLVPVMWFFVEIDK